MMEISPLWDRCDVPCRLISQQLVVCRIVRATMSGTLEMSERQRNEPVLGAVKIMEVSRESSAAQFSAQLIF